MSTGTLESLGAFDLVSPRRYAEQGYPWAEWAALRREAPVYRYEREGVKPFWAITKYDDIQRISRDPETFISSQGLTVERERTEPEADSGGIDFDTLITMDPPKHGKYRTAVNRRFSPRGMRLLEERIDEIGAEAVDAAAAHLVDELTGQRRADFVRDVAAKMPMAAICELMGVPRPMWEPIFDWTNELIGAADPEYQRGRSGAETAEAGIRGLLGYFSGLIAERRGAPGEDVISTLVHAEIDGEPMPDQDVLNYAVLLIIAGNETTRNATSGGLLALLEHPDQLARLRADPALLDSGMEEVLRWTSPIIHFVRTTTRDVEIRGVPIPAGDTVAMWYPSANRDEEIFADPERFDVGRQPNDHLAFGGFGEHYCLGANLARLELRSIFRQVLRRLDGIELDGPVERLNSGLVGGIKHLPIRYDVC